MITLACHFCNECVPVCNPSHLPQVVVMSPSPSPCEAQFESLVSMITKLQHNQVQLIEMMEQIMLKFSTQSTSTDEVDFDSYFMPVDSSDNMDKLSALLAQKDQRRRLVCMTLLICLSLRYC